MQPPPLQLVHRVFGEFEADAASAQPSPDTFDFVLEACGLLAEFYPDEGVRQQLFNKCLEQYLSKTIYRVKLTAGVSETDGSIVDTPNMPEVIAPCCRAKMMSTHHLCIRHNFNLITYYLCTYDVYTQYSCAHVQASSLIGVIYHAALELSKLSSSC